MSRTRIKSQQSGQSWPLMRRAIPFDTTAKRQLKYRLQQELIIAKQKCGCAKRQKSSPGRRAWNVQTAVFDNSYRCCNLQQNSKNSVTLKRVTRVILGCPTSDAIFLETELTENNATGILRNRNEKFNGNVLQN
ncbi:hypothetical protein K0M31_016208 [Melipona bicolor]|uniref:Uncharacterized protein n=1 Tax=Melipona bicolor TaxID=60889 RepID=A0AA40G6N2_9HYME|nr:hypothetical protein K0M31_016208 [Melipona bicolor]